LESIVTIKGTGEGLEIYMDERETYPVLREELMRRLQTSREFFEGSKTKVVIRGKAVTEVQRKELRRVFAMDFGIRDVLFGEEANTMREGTLGIIQPVEKVEKLEQPAKPAEKAKKGRPLPPRIKAEDYTDVELVSNAYFDAQSIFINHTVRSGQRIECEGDVVVLGDVNPGGEVIAGGSIAVFGRLRGLAHAGCRGREDVCVAALNMCPKQLRVSGRIVTFPERREDVGGAEVAELKGGKVVIRPVNYR